MKQLKKCSIMILIIGLIACLSVSTCFAAETGTVNTLETSVTDNNVVFTGTTSDGVLAVSLMVYDETGSKLVKIVSGAVNENAFEIKMELPKGNYLVKAADYEGGKFLEKKFSVQGNPKTGMMDTSQLSLILLSAVALVLVLFLLARKQSTDR